MPLPKKVEVFKGKDKQARVRMVFGNGKKLNVSEGYENTIYATKLANDLAKALKIKVINSTKTNKKKK